MEASFVKRTGRAKIREKATSFSWTPHKAYWTYIQPQIHLILLCAQSEWRGGPVVYLYTEPGSRWPHFFFSGITQRKFELNTGEPSRCYSAKISTVSPLWKGHQVEKTVGTFKTNPRFPPPELYWTSTLRSLLFDSDYKNVEGKCAINKPSVTKINDPRAIPHSNTISPFQNEQKVFPLMPTRGITWFVFSAQ